MLLFNLLSATKSPLVYQIFKLLRALLVMVGPASPGWGGFMCVLSALESKLLLMPPTDYALGSRVPGREEGSPSA